MKSLKNSKSKFRMDNITASEKNIDTILTDVIKSYANFSKEKSISAFMRNTLSESLAYKSNNDIENAIQAISKTIESIRNGHQEIQNYKRKGLPSAIWLRDAIDAATTDLSPNEKSDVIISLTKSLDHGNEQILSVLAPGQEHTPIETNLMSVDFNGINKTGIAQNIAAAIQLNTHLETMCFECVTPPLPNRDTEIQIVKDYFETQLDSDSDEDFKKVISIGFELAKEYELLPESMSNYSTEELTAMVDKGATKAKVAYKIATGEMDITESTDYLIDHATSTAGTMIKQTCEDLGRSAGKLVGEGIGKMGERIFGPTAALIGAKIGEKLGEYAGKKVGEALEYGAKKLGSIAKKATSAIINGAKRLGNAVKDKLSNAFDNVINFFN